MKIIKVLVFSVLIAVFVVGCVSGPPEGVAIRDGIRCPEPSRKMASADKPEDAKKFAVQPTPNEYACGQLFEK